MPHDSLKFTDLAKVFPAADGKPKPMQMPSSGGLKTRILIGDDDPVHTLTIFQTLVEAGYEVVVAERGTDAIAELRKADHPPVAILERRLPGMDGLEICERMRDAGKNVFLILYSVQPTTAEMVAGLEKGADLYLSKTIAPALLVAQIQAGLRTVARLRALAPRPEEPPG
jgi:DNA-binding response OmpR family regulator